MMRFKNLLALLSISLFSTTAFAETCPTPDQINNLPSGWHYLFHQSSSNLVFSRAAWGYAFQPSAENTVRCYYSEGTAVETDYKISESGVFKHGRWGQPSPRHNYYMCDGSMRDCYFS